MSDLNTDWFSSEIICSYPQLHEPHPADAEISAGKYTLTIGVDKGSEELKNLEKAMSNAGFNTFKEADITRYKNFISDGDVIPMGKETADPMYKGKLKFTAKANGDRQPELKFPNGQPVPPDQIVKMFYAGAKIRAHVRCYATKSGGKPTLAFGLEKVMWCAHGERLGGSSMSFEDAFGPVDNSFDVNAALNNVPAETEPADAFGFDSPQPGGDAFGFGPGESEDVPF